MLTRLEKLSREVRNKIISDKQVRQLIFNDSNDPLNAEVPNIAEVKKYITLRPIYSFENTKDYDQNTMINIYLTNAEQSGIEDQMIYGTLQINVVCNLDKWELIDDSCRPLLISNRIIDIVDQVKFSASEQLSWSSLQELIVNKQLVGYALLFGIGDGSGELNNY